MRIIRITFRLLCACLGLGFLLTPFEKKKGWVEGHTPYGPYEKYFKRPLDFGLALFALILLWPFLLLIGIAIRIKMGSPVIFTQDRPGLGGKIFKIKKFRTMTDERDEVGNLLPDENRLTKFGQFLRNTSCDELPELLNIVNGDLSIIGPRPLLVKYLDRYSEKQKHRHDVRPGLTGYAQAHGRNGISWDEKFDMDVWYVDNLSFKTDAKVFIDTIKAVVKHEGISGEGEATMSEFLGSEGNCSE